MTDNKPDLSGSLRWLWGTAPTLGQRPSVPPSASSHVGCRNGSRLTSSVVFITNCYRGRILQGKEMADRRKVLYYQCIFFLPELFASFGKLRAD